MIYEQKRNAHLSANRFFTSDFFTCLICQRSFSNFRVFWKLTHMKFSNVPISMITLVVKHFAKYIEQKKVIVFQITMVEQIWQDGIFVVMSRIFLVYSFHSKKKQQELLVHFKSFFVELYTNGSHCAFLIPSTFNALQFIFFSPNKLI